MPDKSFPTLSSMPRIPRVPRPDADSFDDVELEDVELETEAGQTPPAPGYIRRREASTARPIPRASAARRSPPSPPRAAHHAELTERETTRFWNPDGDWEDALEEPAPSASPPALLSLPRGAAAPAVMPDGAISAAARHPRVATRAIIQHARSPWALARVALGALAMLVALGYGLARAGEPSQHLMGYQASASSKAYVKVAAEVQPLTSLLRPDQYDSPAQFRTYSPAACSPSSLAEVFSAWGEPNATIGHEIDDLGSYLSPYAGLLDQQGFVVAAAKRHYRADIYWHLDYNQLLYLTNTVGIPVIFNVRRDWGYYHYFDGGHFLVATGGDQQGMTIVDSSEYFIKYLPRDVFLSLWEWRGDGSAQTVVIVPQDFQYTIPNV